ncbi:MAG: RNA pseudouridine synthase [Desulfosarcinaceae bacterium]
MSAEKPEIPVRARAQSPSLDFFHPRWPVLFEDNHLLVLYKPAGLIMQRGTPGKHNLVDLAKSWIKTRHAKPGKVFIGMVQRLDAPVAGVVVLARTSKAASRLSDQIRSGSVRKIYLAVVQGRPAQEVGRLENGLVRDGRLSRVVPLSQPGSQAASLTYRLLDRRRRDSLLEISLETGRRHQIRAQLAHLGCPILGDRTYGASESLQHGRIALIAHRLHLTHPTRKTPMIFEYPLPAAWPWPESPARGETPLWTIEELIADGMQLPVRQLAG